MQAERFKCCTTETQIFDCFVFIFSDSGRSLSKMMLIIIRYAKRGEIEDCNSLKYSALQKNSPFSLQSQTSMYFPGM